MLNQMFVEESFANRADEIDRWLFESSDIADAIKGSAEFNETQLDEFRVRIENVIHGFESLKVMDVRWVIESTGTQTREQLLKAATELYRWIEMESERVQKLWVGWQKG